VKELGKYAFYSSKAEAFEALTTAHDNALNYESYEEKQQEKK